MKKQSSEGKNKGTTPSKQPQFPVSGEHANQNDGGARIGEQQHRRAKKVLNKLVEEAVRKQLGCAEDQIELTPDEKAFIASRNDGKLVQRILRKKQNDKREHGR